MNQMLKILTSYLPSARYFQTCCKLSKQTPTNLKGKKHSSQLWIERQLRDPYVEKAKQDNYRCRSAYKLLEIQEESKILSPGQIVMDCGAAPGSWTQVAVKLTNADGKTPNVPKGRVIALDKLPFQPITGAEILCSVDFMIPSNQTRFLSLLKDQKIDVFLSDMAPNATGIKEMDHENIMFLVYSALKFSMRTLQLGGTFLAKVWQGGMEKKLENDLFRFFESVKIKKPPATRSESREIYFLARGFKGVK